MSLFSARSPRALPAWFAPVPAAWRPAGRRVPRAKLRAIPVPSATPAIAGDRIAIGIGAILVSTICFPLSDLAAQPLMASLPPIEVAWLRFVVFFLAALPLLTGGRHVIHSARPGLQVLRGAGSAVATLAAIVSFHFLAVPTTTAISFVAPVIVTALAALVLKEAVGLRRWAAALVALGGVVIIVQPGGDSFRLEALIPFAGAAAGAVAVICTRMNTADGPGTTVLYSAATGLVMLTGLVVPEWQTPSLADLGMALVVGLFGAAGSFLQAFAYRVAPASLLAPFTYTQLIWASGLAFMLLGTVPGAAMMAGAALIALSAVYTAWREQVRGVA